MKDRIIIVLNEIDKYIKLNDTSKALELSLSALTNIKKNKEDENFYLEAIFKISGYFVDIAHLSNLQEVKSKASKIGLDLLEKNRDRLLGIVGEFNYFYFLANAKSNFITVENPFEHDFNSINQLIDHKALLWKSLKASNFSHLQGMTNLANSLKQQFRLVEALKYYDEVIRFNPNIAQAWVNRSETLLMINQVSNSFSLPMLEEVKKGYIEASLSSEAPESFKSYWADLADTFQSKITSICIEEGISLSDYDEHETQAEYESLSEYRKFCLDNDLALSEHGLYCKCNGSRRDELTIPTRGGVTGNFIEPMEKLLNRMKSEFGLARKLYYESILLPENEQEFFELGFSELQDNEELGVSIEKLRTSFRLCFGILDKIGVGVCEMFNIYPDNNQNVYFTNMWRFDGDPERVEKFNSLKNPSLLSLYSISSDLNDKKSGEWSFFKDYRNALEHEYVVIYQGDESLVESEYSEFSFKKKITYIHIDEFESNLLLMLQLTRSAIFSFVYAVRSHALTNKKESDILITKVMEKKGYEE
ncbi:LA2681 family HEPN domain-containing protein [Alteromonas gracilis]|uniref:LA2681 family HEPN domain-containing protein n=1 Tax=Alteromonas gracilis TaxID=1479524 RepID=UPI003736503F